MNKGKLYFTIGCPRSGKSTFTDKWVKYQDSVTKELRNDTYFSLNSRVIVSSDDIRLALHGERYNPLSETIVFAIKHIMIRSHLARGFDVIVDGTNSSEISIMRLLEIDLDAIPIFVDTSIEECKKRAIITGQENLISAIDRIGKNIEHIKKIGLNNYIEQIREKVKQRWNH